MVLSSDLPSVPEDPFDIEMSVEVSNREPALSVSSSVCLFDSCVEDPVLSALVFRSRLFGREKRPNPSHFPLKVRLKDKADGATM